MVFAVFASPVAFLSFLLASTFVSAFVSRTNFTNYNPCGTVVTDDDVSRAEVALSRVIAPRQGGNKEYTFDVYFNVVAANMSESGGWIPQKQVDAQMTLINERYVGTGVSFRLAKVTRILSRYWFETVDADLPQTLDMHFLFRRGKSTALNVFSVGFYDAGLNGYSTLPVNYDTDPVTDGIVLLYATMPGGASRERQGGTMIHEAGHWLGLRHTFQGGCTGVGDGVDDTPAQAAAHFDCPIGIDTCVGGGVDPIHNYMDYTSEACRTEFTPGQIALMQKSIAAFRSNPNI